MNLHFSYLAGTVLILMMSQGHAKTGASGIARAALTAAQVKLEYKVSFPGKKTIELSYKVTNDSDQEIYLYTPLPDSRKGTPVAGRVYIYWDQGDVIHLTKRLWPMAEGIFSYSPEIPFLTRVAPGKKFEERLSLPLPLIVDVPYPLPVRNYKPAIKVKESKGLVFSVGVYNHGPGAPSPDLFKGQSGNLYKGHDGAPGDPGNSIVIRGEQMDLRLSVRFDQNMKIPIP